MRPEMAWKAQARVLGIDDGPPRGDEVDLVGVIARAASGYVEGVLHATVERDGDDATEAMARMTTSCRVYPNIVAVLTHNVTVAGFNTIDVAALAAAAERPVVAVSRGPQDYPAMREALLAGNIPHGEAKWQRIAGCQAPAIHHGGRTLVPAGLAVHEAIELAELCTVRGHLPEPIRLAHLIAAGWVLGESRGQ